MKRAFALAVLWSILSSMALVTAGDTLAAPRASRAERVPTAVDPARGRGETCRRLQRAMQSLARSSELETSAARRPNGRLSKKDRYRVRRSVRQSLRRMVPREVLAYGCYTCIVRQYGRSPSWKHAPCGTHDLCATGEKLEAMRGSCTEAVCQRNPSCCKRRWDESCIGELADQCGAVCSACGHDVCENGSALAGDCDACTGAVCGTDPFCCDTEWDERCVDVASEVCGLTCGPTTTTTTTTTSTTSSTSTSTTAPSPSPPDTSSSAGATTTTLEDPSTTTTTVATRPTPTTTASTTTSTTLAATPPVETTNTTTTTLPTRASGVCVDTLDFEGFPAGRIVSSVQGSAGSGPIAVFGANGLLAGNNAAILYDSRCPNGCTGGDTDLGTPNGDFGGPGVGEGGRAGGMAPNDTALGNLLIVAKNLNDTNHDGLVDVPNDQDRAEVRLQFDFAAVAPVVIHSITFVDIEQIEIMPSVRMLAQNGELLATFAVPATGDNGVKVSSFEAISGVWSMEVTFHGSAAMDDVVFEIGRGCGGTTTTSTSTTTTSSTSTSSTTSTTLPATTTTTTVPPTTTTSTSTTSSTTSTTLPAITTTTTVPPPTTTSTSTTSSTTSTTLPATTTTTTVPPTTTTSTVPVTFDFLCTITVDVTSSAETVGALGYSIDYGQLAGRFVGSGSTVSCRNLLPPGSFTSFFDNEDSGLLVESIIAPAGFRGPLSIAACDFEASSPILVPADFPLTVTDASGVDFSPLDPTVAVTAVQCAAK